MTLYSVSGVTDSVNTGTGSRPVVPNTTFRQPITAFEFSPDRLSIILESGHAPNIFRILVMHNNPLHPSYDRMCI